MITFPADGVPRSVSEPGAALQIYYYLKARLTPAQAFAITHVGCSVFIHPIVQLS